ncbi:uncharacterized protein LOC122372075 isoform X1 [Amphibalanus amphitrite]|uniref:uncharacterized protein LOC122372075 isoform X1 n=1 Tax=Amphibalanus amphitrite TaxID=1232801 RepID=UPI001C903CF4|nr:uncharacterized protein LOC122372075 isoform X1 [Amphibalanus amphitrite]
MKKCVIRGANDLRRVGTDMRVTVHKFRIRLGLLSLLGHPQMKVIKKWTSLRCGITRGSSRRIRSRACSSGSILLTEAPMTPWRASGLRGWWRPVRGRCRVAGGRGPGGSGPLLTRSPCAEHRAPTEVSLVIELPRRRWNRWSWRSPARARRPVSRAETNRDTLARSAPHCNLL